MARRCISLLAIVALIAGLLAMAACESPGGSTSHTIELLVSGTENIVSKITYVTGLTPDDVQEIENPLLPWSYQFTGDEGDLVSLGVTHTCRTDECSVTASILKNGSTWLTETQSGPECPAFFSLNGRI